LWFIKIVKIELYLIILENIHLKKVHPPTNVTSKDQPACFIPVEETSLKLDSIGIDDLESSTNYTIKPHVMCTGDKKLIAGRCSLLPNQNF
jgi:hypothetical protein